MRLAEKIDSMPDPEKFQGHSLVSRLATIRIQPLQRDHEHAWFRRAYRATHLSKRPGPSPTGVTDCEPGVLILVQE